MKEISTEGSLFQNTTNILLFYKGKEKYDHGLELDILEDLVNVNMFDKIVKSTQLEFNKILTLYFTKSLYRDFDLKSKEIDLTENLKCKFFLVPCASMSGITISILKLDEQLSIDKTIELLQECQNFLHITEFLYPVEVEKDNDKRELKEIQSRFRLTILVRPSKNKHGADDEDINKTADDSVCEYSKDFHVVRADKVDLFTISRALQKTFFNAENRIKETEYSLTSLTSIWEYIVSDQVKNAQGNSDEIISFVKENLSTSLKNVDFVDFLDLSFPEWKCWLKTELNKTEDFDEKQTILQVNLIEKIKESYNNIFEKTTNDKISISVCFYNNFHLSCFDDLLETVFCNKKSGLNYCVKYLNNNHFKKKIDLLVRYLELGREIYIVGNKKKAYRIYINICLLLNKIIDCKY